MGTEFLVASLWGVVLVYWLWSRRPSTADTVGLFRRELRVLEGATPTRVAPANRRCVGDVPALAATPVVVAAAAACNKRTEVRRRRRDVLSVLLAVVVLTLAVAAVTRSEILFGAQAACDLALLSYVWLLVRANRARGATARAPRRTGREYLSAPLPLEAYRPPKQPVAIGPTAPLRPAAAQGTRSYQPVHAFTRAVRRAAMGDGDERYGDFDSYASLALANAR